MYKASTLRHLINHKQNGRNSKTHTALTQTYFKLKHIGYISTSGAR